MKSASTPPVPASSGTEGGVPTLNESPPLMIEDRVSSGGVPSYHQPSTGCAQSAADATTSTHPRREDEVAQLALSLFADVLKNTITELRQDDETRLAQFAATLQEEISALRKGEEIRTTRLEKAITDLKPSPINVDPTTNFWTVYKKVADEHDNDLVSRYAGDLDTSLLFAGLFSAVTSAFIAQLIPQLQPDPADLTNVLLVRILEQNRTFNGADPLTPISNIPTSVVKTQQILFASLAITLVVAFVAVLGKQWILYYTRVTSWGNIVDRGKERQAKLVGLQKWGLHLIMESLPVMLQFALLLFGVALAVYLWDLSVSVAKVVLGVTSVGFVFYVCIVISATIWSDCPFQTPLSVLLPKIRPFAKELIVLIRARFERWSRKAATLFLLRIERMTEHGRLTNFLKKVLRTFTGMTDVTNHAGEAAFEKHYTMALSNPAFWRQDPLFDSPISKDIAASAGFWLLENSTDFSAASAVAAVFPEFQWPSHRRSTTALVRLHDTYAECFRVPESNKSTRLKALQSAAAYYVLYHTQLIWSTSNNLEIEVGKLPSDLFVHKPREEWDRDDVFEYLLHVKLEERSEPVTSARFLSYIAPYWFCGDSDATVRFRPRRLDRLPELIGVLEESRALNPTTVTECVLCVGAVMDFPLHPEDLNRVDKSDYFQSAFKLVVEHIHGIVLARGRRSRHTTTALEVLLTLVKKTTLALVEATWINGLLKKAVGGDMDDETFTLLLRLSALRKERDAAADVETPPGQDYAVVQGAGTYPPPPGEIVSPENLTPEHALFSKILKNVETCIGQEGGWQDEAVYGGLVAITDIPRLESCLPEVGFLRTLSKAMEKEGNKPFRVRKAAFDVILVVRDGWLRSVDLRQAFRDSDIPRQLHGVVHETARPDHQVALLEMMEALSNDRYWHPYLRGAMDIWLPFRHEGPDHILCILSKIGGLPLLEYDGSNPPLDEFLEKLVEDEWSGIPGRHVQDLTADRLRPLAEVTERFKELLFAESDRRAVLAVVEQVIPSLERQDGGPGEDVRRTIDDLLKKLRSQSTRRRSNTYWR